jgi:hypothetical protein
LATVIIGVTGGSCGWGSVVVVVLVVGVIVVGIVVICDITIICGGGIGTIAVSVTISIVGIRITFRVGIVISCARTSLCGIGIQRGSQGSREECRRILLLLVLRVILCLWITLSVLGRLWGLVVLLLLWLWLWLL